LSTVPDRISGAPADWAARAARSSKNSLETTPMQKLIEGIHDFQANVFRSHREFFARLAAGQNPEALFITCSDSRIDPSLITQTRPGELFILRNAGNLIPPFGAGRGGEEATIEFAVVGLRVRDIILCGHSHCGAMDALHHPDSLVGMPAVADWLRHAEATRRITTMQYGDVPGAELVNLTVQENVLVQLEHLRTHPAVAAALASGHLKLHGWVYKLETGEVFAFDPERGQFLPVSETRVSAPSRPPRRAVPQPV
jgi:carbonic anhydrase